MQKERYSSLENALRLMNIFTVEKPEYKLNELAEKLSIAPSTVHRLLTTLRSEGFVVKDSLSNKYRLGISLRVLESVTLNNSKLFQLSQDILKQISSRTNLSSALAIIFQESTFYLNAIEVDNPLFSKFYYTGKQCSFLDSSAGKVLLLSKRDTDIPELIREQAPIAKLHAQLHSTGYIESHGDNRYGISSLAVPVKNHKNETIAALEIIGTKKQILANVRIIEEAGIHLANKIKDL
jgi:IclR family transcriptional regulator, KDG regulon repressor